MSSKKSGRKKRAPRPPKVEATSTEQVVFGLLSELISRGVEGGAYKWCLQKNADPARTVFVSCVPADMPDGVICSVMARSLNRGVVEIIDSVKSADSVYQSILVQAAEIIDGDTSPTLIRCKDCPLGYWIMISPVQETNAELLAKKSQTTADVLLPFELEEGCSGRKKNKSSKDKSAKVTQATNDQPPASKVQQKQAKVPAAAEESAQVNAPAAAKESTQESAQAKAPAASKESAQANALAAAKESTQESAQVKAPAASKESAQTNVPAAAKESTQESAQAKAPAAAKEFTQESAQAKVLPSAKESTQESAQAKAPAAAKEFTQESAQAKVPPSAKEAAQAKVPPSAKEAAQAKVPPSAKESAQAKVPPSAKESAQAKVPSVVKEPSLLENRQPAAKEVSVPGKAFPAPKEQPKHGKVQRATKDPSKQAKVPPAANQSLQAEVPLLVSKESPLTRNGPLATEELSWSEKELSQKEKPQQVKMSPNGKGSVRQAYVPLPSKEPSPAKVLLFASKESSTANGPMATNEHSLPEKGPPYTNESLPAPKVPSVLKELPPPTMVLPPANLLPPALPATDEQSSQVKGLPLAQPQSPLTEVLPVPKDLVSSVKVSLSSKPLLMANENSSQAILTEQEGMANLLQNHFNPVVMDSPPNLNCWAQDGINSPVMNMSNTTCNAVWKGVSMERQKRREDIGKGLQFIQSTIPFHGSQDEYKHFLQELVENLFKEGNDLYREGEVKLALGQYTEGFTVADYAESEELVLSQELVGKLLVNRSCCYYSMGLYEKSLEDSDKALGLDKENIRALYRKAKALDKLGKHNEAYSCISHRILTLVQDESVTELAQELVQKLGLKQRRAYKRPQQELETFGLLGNDIATSADSKVSNSIGSIDDIYTDLTGDSNLFTPSLGINSQNSILETAACPPSVSPTMTPTANPGSDLTDDVIGDELDSFLDFDMASKRMPQLIPVFPTGNPLLSVLRPTVLPAPSPLPPASFGLIDLRKPPVVPTMPPLRPAFGLHLDTLDNFDKMRETLDSLDTFANDSRSMEPGPLKGNANIKNGGNVNHIFTPKTEPVQIHPAAVPSASPSNPLMQTYEFKQGCEKCYVKSGPRVLDFTHRERLEHKCNKDILLARMKNSENKQWLKIRPRPMKVNFMGPFLLCKDIQNRQSCKYGDSCTFAYYQEEIDIWNKERKGTFHRDKLFQPSGSVKSGSVARLLHEQKGIFTFLCQACFDSKPRIISKRNPGHPEFCTNPTNQHIFNDNRCLVHVLNSSKVKYSKIRPLHLRFQMDVCRHEIRYGCIQEDTCNFAHSHVELKVWLLQKQSGITQEEIVLESERMWKIPEPKAKPLPKPLDMKMKFVCGQCLGHGREIEADRDEKYCAAKARHSWTKERVLLVMSKSKKKWVPVRPLPSVRSFPQHYEICVHVKKGKKCQYIGSCNFAHNTEEKDVWTYMKESRVLDLQQVFDLCNKSNHPAEKPEIAAAGTAGLQKEAEKQILMPTDYADLMAGFHCYLCGKNSNSEKQWQKHIQSEKHKDRVFTLESEDCVWKYRFPAGEFKLCDRYEETQSCANENNCPFAHGIEELTEWNERKDVLQLKVSKARQDKLLDPSDSDFGKYTFLVQDLSERNVKKELTGTL